MKGFSFVEKMIIGSYAIRNPNGKFTFGMSEGSIVVKESEGGILGWDILQDIRGTQYTSPADRDVITIRMSDSHWILEGCTEGFDGTRWIKDEPYGVERMFDHGVQGRMGYIPYGRGNNEFEVVGKELVRVPVEEKEVMEAVKLIRQYDPDYAWIAGNDEVFTGYQLYIKKDNQWFKEE